MIYNYDDNLRYHDDVKNKFGFANINAFPKNFDIKDINENLNGLIESIITGNDAYTFANFKADVEQAQQEVEELWVI